MQSSEQQQHEEFEVQVEDDYPFTMMPHWVALAEISDTAFRLYNALLMHLNRASGARTVWPSKDSLAALVGMKKAQSVDPHLNQLYAIGAVVVKHQRTSAGMKKRNVYILRLNPPAGNKTPTILSEWYRNTRAESAVASPAEIGETPGRYVHPGEGVPSTENTASGTPQPGCYVHPGEGVKQEQIKHQQQQNLKSITSKIASRSTDVTIRRDDVELICKTLADALVANGTKRQTISEKKWRDAARLMLDRDGRSLQEVLGAIRWSQGHAFWSGVILSMPKLREKYDQLRMQAQRDMARGGLQGQAGGLNGRRESTTDQRVRAGLELAEKMAALDAQIAGGNR